MTRILKTTLGFIFVVIVPGLFLSACWPVSDAERAYLEERRVEYQYRQAEQTASVRDGVGEALELVKRTPAENEAGTVEQWIEQELSSVDGQVMFPRWDVKRRGAHHYEVRFTYTVLRDDYAIEKKGMAWNVDLVLKIVGPMRTFEPEEVVKLPRTPPARMPKSETNKPDLNLE